MRLVSFVLAVFVSFLVLQPCADFDSHLQDEKNVHIENTHSHGSDAQDGCSIFCTCVCCGISLQMAALHFYKDEEVSLAYVSNNFEYHSFYKSCFINTIWDPPTV